MALEVVRCKATANDPLISRTAGGKLDTLPHLYELTSHCYGKLKPDSPQEAIVVKLAIDFILIIAHCAVTRRSIVCIPSVDATRDELAMYAKEFAWLCDGKKSKVDLLLLTPSVTYNSEALYNDLRSLTSPLGLELSFRTQRGYDDPKDHPSVAIVERGTAKATIVDLGKGMSFNSSATAIPAETERNVRVWWPMFISFNNFVIKKYDQAPPQLLEQYDGDKGATRLPVLCDSARMMLINCRVGMPVDEFLERTRPGQLEEKAKLGLEMMMGMLLRLPKFCIVCAATERANTQAQVKKIRRCTGCNAEEYCSEEHQKQDWKAGHKRLCKDLQLLHKEALARQARSGVSS